MDRNSGLVVAFFDQARAVSSGSERYLELSSTDLVAISLNPAMRAEFKRQLAGINDPEVKDQIVQFVLDYADAAEEDARGAERRVDLLDRAGLGIAASVTACAIAVPAASGKLAFNSCYSAGSRRLFIVLSRGKCRTSRISQPG